MTDETYDTEALIAMAVKDKGKPFAQYIRPEREQRNPTQTWASDPPDDPAERIIWEANKARLRSTQCPPGWAIKKHMAERPELYDYDIKKDDGKGGGND